MLLVQQKEPGGTWEVPWTWLPYFLALDKALHSEVDEALLASWRGREAVPGEMHKQVIREICTRRPIAGLEHYLQSVESIIRGGEVLPSHA
jgi:hypothetical protein